ncbi:hypothetical protein EDEG_02065 [Edhazardia aedis USNM 41457]|uniref:C3H1-type domain-containing protein n=1 Tax=Edhazardia aedis (strain USNM 41457) TaxID=1003232 RepID=J9DQL2_EDHAE|nr:hypothetical protein EDEG_02065 [Edhazardia aedis USNM 41457]|eukprot:EJW03597.1 hypothetical protein EDEG_02065 [Edhazardia aedis USNM 41457]
MAVLPRECRDFKSSGTCRYGKQCKFAHILQTPLLNPPFWIFTNHANLGLLEFSCEEMKLNFLLHKASGEIPSFERKFDDAWVNNYAVLFKALDELNSDFTLCGVSGDFLVDLRVKPSCFVKPFDPHRVKCDLKTLHNIDVNFESFDNVSVNESANSFNTSNSMDIIEDSHVTNAPRNINMNRDFNPNYNPNRQHSVRERFEPREIEKESLPHYRRSTIHENTQFIEKRRENYSEPSSFIDRRSPQKEFIQKRDNKRQFDTRRTQYTSDYVDKRPYLQGNPEYHDRRFTKSYDNTEYIDRKQYTDKRQYRGGSEYHYNNPNPNPNPNPHQYYNPNPNPNQYNNPNPNPNPHPYYNPNPNPNQYNNPNPNQYNNPNPNQYNNPNYQHHSYNNPNYIPPTKSYQSTKSEPFYDHNYRKPKVIDKFSDPQNRVDQPVIERRDYRTVTYDKYGNVINKKIHRKSDKDNKDDKSQSEGFDQMFGK